MDSRGRPFYLIDRERVSQETYHDSFRKSENVRTYQSRDKESGRFGSFRPEFYERREALRESERISQARREPGRIPTRIAPVRNRYVVAEFTERIRGTRISQTIIRVYAPGVSISEVRHILGSQYDTGGNYVLTIESVERTEPTSETRAEVARSYSEGITATGDADRS